LARNLRSRYTLNTRREIKMATKQEVADYINANAETVLTAEEIAKIDEKMNPEVATILIKLLGDVSFLVHVRDNGSN
jgi:hypothetical protein